MDFSFTLEQEQFRRDLRAFFAEERVGAILTDLRRLPPHQEHHSPQIYRWLGERRWLAPNWPVEYGGLGRTPVEAAILAEEMARAGVSDVVHVNSVMIVGLFILLAGTEEQRARFLPKLASGEMVANVLYTEPDVGSDLASLSTRAMFDDNGYLIYGTKVYNQITQFSQYGLTAARTRGGQNKYDGITLFLVPLDTRGVEVRPLWNISDDRFSEVVFDGAWVGSENVLGRLHEGWDVIDTALAIERTGLDYYVKLRRWLDAIIDRARVTGRLTDPRIGHRIVALDAEVEAGRAMVYNMISQLTRNEVDSIQAAAAKWYTTEVGRHIARLGLDLDGLGGLLTRWDGDGSAHGRFEAAYRDAPGLTLSAGSSEIMLYMIAASGLEIVE